MFKKIRDRLLYSYLIILGLILLLFAVGVRAVFSRMLIQQLAEKMTTLAQGASSNLEYEHGKLNIGEDISQQDLINRHQSLEWFDPQRHLLVRKGNLGVNLPFSNSQPYQIQNHPYLLSVTLPIKSEEQHFIGYVRASQSLEEIGRILKNLDLALGSGIFLALLLSGLGGIWLTQQAMQPIEESFKRLKQFTADASHELRNPLMVAKGNARLALRYPEGIRETDIEKFQEIINATDQMTHLTEDLLFLARNDREGKTIEEENVDLSLLLNQLMISYKTQVDTKEITLLNQVNSNLFLVGNSSQVSRLFANLMVNAIHYTHPQGIISIQASQSNSLVVVTVQDNGMGIAQADLPKIFDRFWRADQSRSSGQDSGSGLGLAIAQAIAINHGGEITVTSQLEKGSRFTVTFDVNKVSPKNNHKSLA